ncbi:MAG: hypothetical protein II982_01615 [Clostridia bacterium]|nr:hypothetical protein [Clostridia bacterium]
MKKKFFVLGIVLLTVLVIFGSLYIFNNKPVEITKQTAIENVTKMLDEKSIEIIINLDNPKIEEIVFDTQHFLHYFEENTDIVGKDLYKITFNTTQDGLLGPIVFYVDKENGKVLGTDYRY